MHAFKFTHRKKHPSKGSWPLLSLLVIVLLFFCCSGFCQDPNISEKLDIYLSAWLKNRQFSGAVLVAEKGNILLKKAYGNANDEKEIPLQTNTKFRIASLTKSFTVMALMQLEEIGKIKMNDPIEKYIPDYPRGDEITLFQLVHHTSGVPDFLSLHEYWEKLNGPCATSEAVELFKNKSLQFEPGSHWEYSNSGYVLLGFIIEKVTGRSLAEYLEKNIFKPLNMENTGWESEQPIETFGATGYVLQNQSRMPTASVNMSVNHGAGALYSTIEDLYKWDRALYTEELVTKATLAKIFTPHLNAYGGGWGIMKHQRFGKPFIFMNGRFSGFTANISRYPEEDVCIIVLSNLMDLDPRIIADNLAANLFEELVALPGNRKKSPISPEIYKSYLGTYLFEKMTPPLKIEIAVNANGNLIRKISDRPDKEIIFSGKDRFFYADNDVELIFEKDKTGAYNNVILNLIGTPFKGVRL